MDKKNIFLLSFFSLAQSWAQDGAPAASQASSGMQFIPIALAFLAFYFIMLRPKKKQMEEEQTFLKSLKHGDEVYTKSGMLGTVTGMTEKLVTLEVSEGVKMKFLRGHIAGSAKVLFEPPAKKN